MIKTGQWEGQGTRLDLSCLPYEKGDGSNGGDLGTRLMLKHVAIVQGCPHPSSVIQVNVERVMKALKECGEKGKQLILAAVPLIAQEPDWTDTIRDLQVRTTT